MTDLNGLLYMRARYYNPYLCRFINPDPAGFAGGLNFYCYADGNPVSWLDPFGLGAQESGSISFSDSLVSSGSGSTAGISFSGGMGTYEPPPVHTPPSTLTTLAIIAATVVLPEILPEAAEVLTGERIIAEGEEAVVAAETAPKLLNPGINVTEQGMQHVLERHIVNGIPEYATRSKFTTGVNLEELIQQGTQMPMVRQANGYFARTFDAGRAVGIDRATGQASSVVTIITKPNGNLVTMFPGAP
jgi:hypothetical protein